MIPRLSRSQPMSAPATATEPSSAYVAASIAKPGGDGRDQPVSRRDGPIAGVHEHEAAGAVRALDLAGLEAGLPEERRLLVAEIARDRDAGEVPDPLAVDLGRRTDRRQHRRRDADRVEQLRLPGERLEAHQHRARGVRDVGHVDAAPRATRQVPDEPAVDRAEQQVARPRPPIAGPARPPRAPRRA